MDLDPSEIPLFVRPTVPRTVGELEVALGLRFHGLLGPAGQAGMFSAPDAATGPLLSGCIQSLTARFAWDLQRDPLSAPFEDLRHRMLTRYSVTFSRSWPTCESLLRDRYGQALCATEVTDTDTRAVAHTYLVYGPYFLLPLAEGFQLDWYERRPDWAAPAYLPEVRARWLRELPRRLRRATRTDEMLHAIATPYAQAGLSVGGMPDLDRAVVELTPAMRVVDLVDALELRDAFIQSWDVHMSAHHLVVADIESGGCDASEPTFGVWKLGAGIVERPQGEWIRPGPPAASRHRIDPRDIVRGLEIRRRP